MNSGKCNKQKERNAPVHKNKIGQRDNYIITRRLNVEYLQDSVLNEQGSNVGVGQTQCEVSGSKLQDLGIILQIVICI